MDKPMFPGFEEFPREDFVFVAQGIVRDRQLSAGWIEFVDANAAENPNMPWELWCAICVWHLTVHNTLGAALGDGNVDTAYDFEARMTAVAKDVFSKSHSVTMTHITHIKEGLRNEMRRLPALDWIAMHNKLLFILQDAAYALFRQRMN